MEEQQDILIMGLGNLLLGDEGVGVHAVRELSREDLPPGLSLLDAGTGGFTLMTELTSGRVIIMIDASLGPGEPGTIHYLKPRFASDFPRSLSSHDIGLKDLIESAAVLGKLPEIHLVTVTIDPQQEIGMELSPPIRSVLPRIREEVFSLVERIREEKAAGSNNDKSK